MGRSARLALFGSLAGALFIALEFAPTLLLGLEGDDFELLSLARVGGFAGEALVVPHRGIFLKPVLNLLWATLVPLFGASPLAWHALALIVHIANAALFGLLAATLSARWGAPSGHAQPASEDRPRESMLARQRPMATGAVCALLWGAHDRLAEPVFSLASLNHSLTFLFYLLALLALLRALRAGSWGETLLAVLLVLITLLSYEVGISVLLAAALVLAFDPDGSLRDRMRRIGAPLAVCAAAYLIVQLAVRMGPGSLSYYSASPALALRNLAAVFLAFLHIPSHVVEPGEVAGAVLLVLLGSLLAILPDRVARFGIAWFLAAWLPIAPIPTLSDRYNYIAFAGFALACGHALVAACAAARDPSIRAGEQRRSSGSWFPRGAALAGSLLMALHLVWSFAGAREQAAYFRVKGYLAGLLERDARAALGVTAPAKGTILVLLWAGEPDTQATLIGLYDGGAGALPVDAEGLRWWPVPRPSRWVPPRIGERSHPVYVRSGAILGVVYPADLFGVAAAGTSSHFRVPAPGDAARAVVAGQARIAPLLLSPSGAAWTSERSSQVLSALANAIHARREVPDFLPLAVEDLPSPLRVAYLEIVDRSDAYAAEYER